MKRTPWFPVSTPPVREGWFEFKGRGFPAEAGIRSYWNGREWGEWSPRWVAIPFVGPGDYWRGLTQPAE